MLSEEAKGGILEWLFGKKPLEKASQQGTSTPQKSVNPVPQDNTYLKKQIDRKMAEEKAAKEAMDKLKVVK